MGSIDVKILAYIFMSIKNHKSNMKRGLFCLGLMSFLILSSGAKAVSTTRITDNVLNWCLGANSTNATNCGGAIIAGGNSTTLARRYVSFIKYDLTPIANLGDITQVNLTAYSHVAGYDNQANTLDIALHHVYNDTWDDVTWFDNPCITEWGGLWTGGDCNYTKIVNITNSFQDWVGEWHTWDITDIVNNHTDNNEFNLSFAMRGDRPSSNGGFAAFSTWVLDVEFTETANFTAFVYSESEYEADGNIFLNIRNYTQISFAGRQVETTQNATVWIQDCSFSDGVWYECYGYNFTDVATGSQTINVSKVGYRDYYETFELSSNLNKNIYLKKYDRADLFVQIKNSTGNVPNAKLTLYFQNHSEYEEGGLLAGNPVYTDSNGWVRWYQLPLESYFVVIDAVGHYRVKAPTFALIEDKNISYTLTATANRLTLSCTNSSIQTDEWLNCSIAFTGMVAPFSNVYVKTLTPDGDIHVKMVQTNDNPYSFLLYGGSYFTDGTNKVWVEYRDVISNEIIIEVTGLLDVDRITDPMLDMPFAEAGWVGALFSPFAIALFFMVGISAYFEAQVKSHGAVFLAVMIVTSIGLSILGVFPIWFGFVAIVICSAILTKVLGKW